MQWAMWPKFIFDRLYQFSPLIDKVQKLTEQIVTIILKSNSKRKWINIALVYSEARGDLMRQSSLLSLDATIFFRPAKSQPPSNMSLLR